MQVTTPARYSNAEASVPSGNDDASVSSDPISPASTLVHSRQPRAKLLRRRSDSFSKARTKVLEETVARLETRLCELESGREYVPEANLIVEKKTSVFDTAEATLRSSAQPVEDPFPALVSLDADLLATSESLARMWFSNRTIPSQLLVYGITHISPYPFATTPSSNISQGMMDSNPVALKAFRRSQTQPVSEEELMRFFFEGLVSSSITHPNVLPVLGMHIGPSGDLYLVSKLMRNGSLPDYLAAHPDADKLLLLTKVAAAVAHLHSLPTPVLHGDIRGPNVLVGDDGEPLLIDFGFALVMNPVTSEFSPASHFFVGNARWTPNEKIRASEYPLTLKADSFSFGSLMLEVLSGNVPYNHLVNDGAVIVEVLVRKKTPVRPTNVELTDPLWALMTKCWSLAPASRPTMDEIHRYLLAEMAATPPA